MSYEDVLNFWFKELEPKQWFIKDEKLDQEIQTRFTKIHEMGNVGELFTWRDTPEGRLAEIIVLDQFSRNIYRNDPRSFSSDPLAMVLAQETVRSGNDMKLEVTQRAFIYMPYMHSESSIIHEQAVKLFSCPGMENNLDFEYKHKKIIDRFGRYPHRNEILGRESTPEEIEFLKGPDSSF